MISKSVVVLCCAIREIDSESVALQRMHNVKVTHAHDPQSFKSLEHLLPHGNG